MLIAVWPERSSCPCFAAALAGKPVSHSDGSWNFQGTASRKRKRPPTQYRRRILSGETAAKRSGVLWGGTFFWGAITHWKWWLSRWEPPLFIASQLFNASATSLACISQIWSFGWAHFLSCDNVICDKGSHGLQGASRWFWVFYCGKAIIVGLIEKIGSFQHSGHFHKFLPIHTEISSLCFG